MYLAEPRVSSVLSPSTLAGVRGDAGVIMPFNWGSWDVTHIWGAAALNEGCPEPSQLG